MQKGRHRRKRKDVGSKPWGILMEFSNADLYKIWNKRNNKRFEKYDYHRSDEWTRALLRYAPCGGYVK